MKKPSVCLTCAVLCLHVQAAIAADVVGNASPLETLRQCWEASRSTLSHIRIRGSLVAVDASGHAPEIAAAPKRPIEQGMDYGTGRLGGCQSMEYARDGERARYCRLSAGLELPTQRDERSLAYSPEDFSRFGNGSVYDGVRLLAYYATSKEDSRTSVGRADLSEGGVDLLWLDGHFPGELFCIARGATVGDLLGSPSVVVGAEPELVGGQLCFRVEARVYPGRMQDRVLGWLAIDRGCFPVQMELWSTTKGQGPAENLVRRMVVASFLHAPSGYWLPGQVVHTTYQHGHPIMTFTYSVLDVELQPRLPPGAFSTSIDSLPQGALVQDMASGAEFIVGEAQANEGATRRVADAADKKNAKNTEHPAPAAGVPR